MAEEAVGERSNFELLLTWLDPNEVVAGELYEQIRRRLIKIFYARGCHLAEELADETIERVTKKAGYLIQSYEGDPVFYFLGVARRVHLEFTRDPKSDELPANLTQTEQDTDELEQNDICLEECLSKLSPEKSGFILEYYSSEKQAKIDCRKQMMEKLGMSHGALRIHAYRIRKALQKCVFRCLEKFRE